MPPLRPQAPQAADERSEIDALLARSGTKLDKAALSECFEDRPYTLLRRQRAMLFRVDQQSRQQAAQRVVGVVQVGDTQRSIAAFRRLCQLRAQSRVFHRRRKLGEQCADLAVLLEADVGATLIFLCRQAEHHGKQPHRSLREGGTFLSDAHCKFLHAQTENGSDFGSHAISAERCSASTRLCTERQYQPENALTGSMLRPSSYSRAAEIQIAAPLRLAKISHQCSALGSAFNPLACSQMPIASARGIMPPGRAGSVPAQSGSIAQARSSNGSPRWDISQSRMARISPLSSTRKFPVR